LPTFEFDVVNNMSPKIKVIDNDLKELTVNVNVASKAIDGLGTHKGGFFGAKGFFASEQIKKVFEFGKEVFKLGKEFVEAVAQSQELKEETLSMLGVMGLSKEAAESEFEAIGDIAKHSAMTKKEVIAEYQELFSFSQRFGTEATQNVIKAGTDIQKLLGKGAQEAFVGVVRNIDAMGSLNARMVKQLKEVGVATPEKLYKALATNLHTTVKGAEAMVKAGRVGKAASIDTLLDLVQQNAGKGNQLGSYAAERTAGNYKDQVKNLGEAWDKMFEDIDTSPLADALKELTTLFDPTTESGQRMKEELQIAFGYITDSVKFATTHMEDFFNVVVKTLGAVEGIAKFMLEHPILSSTLAGAAAGGITAGPWGALFGATIAGGAAIGMSGGDETKTEQPLKNLGISTRDLHDTNETLTQTTRYSTSAIEDLTDAIRKAKTNGGIIVIDDTVAPINTNEPTPQKPEITGKGHVARNDAPIVIQHHTHVGSIRDDKDLEEIDRRMELSMREIVQRVQEEWGLA
jgi:hypothetical protein